MAKPSLEGSSPVTPAAAPVDSPSTINDDEGDMGEEDATQYVDMGFIGSLEPSCQYQVSDLLLSQMGFIIQHEPKLWL